MSLARFRNGIKDRMEMAKWFEFAGIRVICWPVPIVLGNF